MEWESIYHLYPVNDKFIWLNNCGIVPAGSHIIDAVDRFLKAYAVEGYLSPIYPYAQVQARIKTILAELLGCDPDELALIHHTSEGMNYISHGLRFNPGDEIVLLENEYPSNVYPWWHWRDKGVVLKYTPMAADPSEFLTAFKRRLTPRTRAVALSAVHWCTGMPLPLDQIGRLCRERDIVFVVDGAQGVGMQPLNVKAAHISYMAFSAWKWLMGPLGLGVLYLPKANIEKLTPIFVGAGSVVQDEEYLPYKDHLKPTAERFTISTPNFIDWVYFLAGLEKMQAIGFERIRNRVFALGGYLSDGLEDVGCKVLARRHPDNPTGIIVFEKKSKPSKQIVETLGQHRIIGALRLDRVRLAPHIYNSTAQLDQVIETIASF